MAAVVLVASVSSACAGGTPTRSRSTADALLGLPLPDHVTVSTRRLPGLGTVLVDGSGRTLYMFPPDAGSKVTCTGPCAGTWPPLVIRSGRTPAAAGSAQPQDIATLPDPNSGARIVTYAGYPLYRYAGDLAAGTANGQSLFVNGGPWYVLTPDGNPVTTEAGSGS